MANFCTKCGLKVEKHWKYCPNCGELLPNLEQAPIHEATTEDEEINLVNVSNDNEPLDHPTLPRKVDRQIFEGRLKEYRSMKAGEERKSPVYIFDNKAIDALVEARNRILIVPDLFNIKYWSDYRIDKYGKDIIDILNQLDQNYIPKKK